MKISTFKVPVTITKNGKNVDLKIREDEKTLFKEQSLDDGAEGQILKLSKQVSDHNEKQKAIAKKSMMGNDKVVESFIFMQFLT